MQAERFIEVVMPLALPRRLTYRVPTGMCTSGLVGCRVMAPLGRGKVYTALCVKDYIQPEGEYKIRDVVEIVDDDPVVTDDYLKFWDWLGRYYMATPGEVYISAMPSVLRFEADSKISAGEVVPEDEQLNDQEFLVMEALSVQPELSFKEVSAITGIKRPAQLLERMQERGWIKTGIEIKEKVRARKEIWYEIHPDLLSEEAIEKAVNGLNRSPVQQEALLLFLQHSGWYRGDYRPMPQATLKLALGPRYSGVTGLLNKNILIKDERLPGGLSGETESWPDLSSAQQKVLEQCRSGLVPDKPLYLYGVTGSGKTEIYMHLAKEKLDAGYDVVFLLPEISLTTQMVERISRRFPGDVLVYHSRLSEGERATVWRQIRRNDRKRGFLVLGVRSALMLPVKNPGLFIVDEEHEPSYKQQDPAPRYHARDAALYLGKLLNQPILLGSATPSAESWYMVKHGRYSLVKLENRHGDGQLPEIEVIDMAHFKSQGLHEKPFSKPFVEQLKKTLAAGRQILLFQNRRGFARHLRCEACGFIPECPNCDITLTYHKAEGEICCHACGYRTAATRSCAVCAQPKMRAVGFGTERIEEQTAEILPGARVERMDWDTTRKKTSLQEIFNRFENRQTDVLVGTQMIVKGLDFGNVGLVGVMFADQLMYFPDFRSNERAVQMLSQVGGRAGRKNAGGKVLIQTFTPAHPVILAVQQHNYLHFIENELVERQRFGYPPYTRMIHFLLRNKDADAVIRDARQLTSILAAALPGYRIDGPATPVVSRIRNKYLQQIYLRIPREDSEKQVKNKIRRVLAHIAEHENHFSEIRLDVDPV